MVWIVKSFSDTETVVAEVDAEGNETGEYRYEFADGQVHAVTDRPGTTVHSSPRTARRRRVGVELVRVGVIVGIVEILHQLFS